MHVSFDEDGNFIHISFGNLQEMTECFRRRVVKFFLDSKLINQKMADNLLRWKHSGFSIDSSIPIFGESQKERENLAQYIGRLSASPTRLRRAGLRSMPSPTLGHLRLGSRTKKHVHRPSTDLSQEDNP